MSTVSESPVSPARQQRRALTGVLLLDKPVGLSSTSALGRARWLYQAEKAGHTGTLDPFATGLLPLCFGEATKFSRFMLDAEKSYRATLKLGSRTPSGDTETAPFEARPVSVDTALVESVLKGFLGPQTQIPPMHSALKQDGVPLYKLARKGLEVERAARYINVLSLDLISLDGDCLIIDCRVSKGTYIRVLAEDIGEALGCGAHLTGLRRTATGGYSIGDAVTLDELEAMSLAERDQRLKTCESLCDALSTITLNATSSLAFGHGQLVKIALSVPGEYQIRSDAGRFLGIAQVEVARPDTLKAVRLMA
jgi:tRNA pseudouridine55 synthase